jgi:hypothetical protein
MLTFRKAHPHVDDSYLVIHDGIAVGSIERRQFAFEGDVWLWKLYHFGRVVPGDAGQERSSDLAEAAFRAAWVQLITPRDLDWIRQRATPKKKVRRH